MIISHLKVIELIGSVCVLSLFFSCSKDTDLLADYVMAEDPSALLVAYMVLDDSYVLTPDTEVVLDVLSNDTFSNPDKVKIVETTQPKEGTVLINEDNTLTYIPSNKTEEASVDTNPQETVNDEPVKENKKNTDEVVAPNEKNTEHGFTYTVETKDDDGNTTAETAEVRIELDYGSLKAFPGAEGFGKNATGGRGGTVIHVTNLSDTGPGSLRNALEKISGKKTIVFDVSGYIVLKSQLKIRPGYGNVTIAGQTAPGDGITLRGHGLEIWDSNVIIRYLRIRVGTEQHDPKILELDALRIGGTISGITNNIIVDHCSFSWASDELASVNSVTEGAKIKNVTYQNCILAEGIASRYGMLVGAGVSRISIYNNLFAHNMHRNMRNSYSAPDIEFEFINNIIYDYSRATEVSFGNTIDIIGNIYKVNENKDDTYAINYGRSLIKPDYDPAIGNIHQSDNRTIDTKFATTNSTFDKYGKANRALTHSLITPTSSAQLENKLLHDLGANIFGSPVDKRILEEYKTSTGFQANSVNDTEDFFGGYPNLTSGTRSAGYDSDYDGMADAWELSHSLDPENPDDGKSDKNGDGFTNLEDFLHSLTIK